MITKLLKAFTTTARVGSFQKASDLLFISSTALIKQINALEEDTGLTLFVRTNRGIQLTEEGKAFYSVATDILHRYHDGIQGSRQSGYSSRSLLRIGFSPISPCHKCMDVCFHDRKHFGKFVPCLIPISGDYRDFFDEMQNLGSHVDVIPYFLGDHMLESVCGTFCLARLPLKIAVPLDHPLHGRDRLTWHDLKGHKLVTISSDANHYYRQFNDTILAHVPEVSLIPVRHYDYSQLNDSAALNQLVLAGSCFSQSHPLLKLHDVDWELTLPYGLYYSKKPSQIVMDWLSSFRACGISGMAEDAQTLFT